MIGVRLDTPSGPLHRSYSPCFFLDNDRAIAIGREVQGQPKRASPVGLEIRGDLVVGTVTATGIDVLTGTLPYKEREASLGGLRSARGHGHEHHLKTIPNLDGMIRARQLVARELANVRVPECWSGPGTVELRPNAAMPLYPLPVLEYLEGYYWRAEFDLVAGRVIYDYPQTAEPNTHRLTVALATRQRAPARSGSSRGATACRCRVTCPSRCGRP